jgi:hypothetical protein
MYDDPDWPAYFASRLFGEKYIQFYERVWNQQKNAERLVVIFALIGLFVGSFETMWYLEDNIDTTTYDWTHVIGKDENTRDRGMRAVVSVTTILSLIFLIRRYRVNVE